VPEIKPRTPGLTELRQPDNHQPLQSSICTEQLPQLYTWQPLNGRAQAAQARCPGFNSWWLPALINP